LDEVRGPGRGVERGWMANGGALPIINPAVSTGRRPPQRGRPGGGDPRPPPFPTSRGDTGPGPSGGRLACGVRMVVRSPPHTMIWGRMKDNGKQWGSGQQDQPLNFWAPFFRSGPQILESRAKNGGRRDCQVTPVGLENPRPGKGESSNHSTR